MLWVARFGGRVARSRRPMLALVSPVILPFLWSGPWRAVDGRGKFFGAPHVGLHSADKACGTGRDTPGCPHVSSRQPRRCRGQIQAQLLYNEVLFLFFNHCRGHPRMQASEHPHRPRLSTQRPPPMYKKMGGQPATRGAPHDGRRRADSGSATVRAGVHPARGATGATSRWNARTDRKSVV